MIGEALALNKALERKKEMAANYRALAETHRYDLDQADALLKGSRRPPRGAGPQGGTGHGLREAGRHQHEAW